MSTNEKNITFYQKQLGKRVKALRKDKHFSQLDLASICNYEKTTISRIENGRTNITLKTLVNLSLALEVELKAFFETAPFTH